jgi:3-phenylpropionate/cinnamic acid dioxygenase small subunit
VTAVDRDLAFAVEQFLYHEALLLDEGRFEEWLALLDDEVRYVMPTRPVRDVRSAADDGTADAARVQLHYLEEDRTSLAQRIERMAAGNAWAEVPPSRTTRSVSNVLVRPGPRPATLAVSSNLVLYRQRLEGEVELFVGRRDDELRPVDDGFRLAARTITLTANMLPGKNLSVIF